MRGESIEQMFEGKCDVTNKVKSCVLGRNLRPLGSGGRYPLRKTGENEHRNNREDREPLGDY